MCNMCSAAACSVSLIQTYNRFYSPIVLPGEEPHHKEDTVLPAQCLQGISLGMAHHYTVVVVVRGALDHCGTSAQTITMQTAGLQDKAAMRLILVELTTLKLRKFVSLLVFLSLHALYHCLG